MAKDYPRELKPIRTVDTAWRCKKNSITLFVGYFELIGNESKSIKKLTIITIIE